MAYGLEVTNADGTLAFSSQDTAASIVAIIEKPYAFSGTVSIPKFDDTRGSLIVTYDTVPGPEAGVMNLPTVNWDNITKILTLSPAGFIPPGSPLSDYKIILFHYKGPL